MTRDVTSQEAGAGARLNHHRPLRGGVAGGEPRHPSETDELVRLQTKLGRVSPPRLEPHKYLAAS